MSTHGGKREGAGRKPGSLTRFQREQHEKAKAGGLMPVDYMLEVLRDETVPRAERLDAAKAAAPYVTSKMPTAIVAPPNANPEVGLDDEEILTRYMIGLHAEADPD